MDRHKDKINFLRFNDDSPKCWRRHSAFINWLVGHPSDFFWLLFIFLWLNFICLNYIINWRLSYHVQLVLDAANMIFLKVAGTQRNIPKNCCPVADIDYLNALKGNWTTVAASVNHSPSNWTCVNFIEVLFCVCFTDWYLFPLFKFLELQDLYCINTN